MQRAFPGLIPHRVLLVEDNPVNQLVAKRLLGRFELAITLAENGREALDRYADAEQPFDAIVMDCQMPGDGRICRNRFIARARL